MPAIISLIATILGAISSARGNSTAESRAYLTQLGSNISDLIGNSKRKVNPNLSDRGYPSSRFGN